MQATTLRKPVSIASALLVAGALAFAGTVHAAGPRAPPEGRRCQAARCRAA